MTVVITLSNADVENLKDGGIIPVTLSAQKDATGTTYRVEATKTSAIVATEYVGTIAV